MKNLLNQFSIWLYRKTKVQETKTLAELFLGWEIMTSTHLPKNKIVMGTGETKELFDTSIKLEIEKKEPEPPSMFGKNITS